jgi:hypothetical protein
MFPSIGRNNEESLPKWITSSYDNDKDKSTFETITQQLGATLVTNIETVVVGGFYLARMPWYNGNYADTLREMIEKANQNPEITVKMEENKKNSVEYLRKYDRIKNEFDKQYNDCFFEGDVADYERLQLSLTSTKADSYKVGVEQSKLYQKHAANKEKCQHFITKRDAALDKLTETAPHGFTKVEQLYAHLQKLQNKPLLFINVLGIQDGMIRCHGYDVTTGIIYSTTNDRKLNVSSDVDVFFMHFRDVELYSFKDETESARRRFDNSFVDPLKQVGKLGGKRRSKTNGRFRKYWSRRNISSRTQRRKKTQRRQRR